MPDEFEQRRAPRRLLTLLLGAYAGIAPMSIDMYLPGIPAIKADLNASAQAVTAMLSIFIGGLAVGQLLAGPWSDRVGRRTPVLAGLIVYLCGSLCVAFTTRVDVILLSRVMQALGASAVMVTGRAVVRDLFDERDSARYFSKLALVSGLAPVLAPLVGTAVMSVVGWRFVFMLMALVAAILFVAAALMFRETRSLETARRARDTHPLRTYAALLRNRQLLGFLLTASFNAASLFTYLGSAPLVLMKIYGVRAPVFSLIMAGNSVGLVAASQVNRYLLVTRTPQQVLRGSARNALVLAVAFALFSVTLSGGMPLMLALIFVVLASLSIIQANTTACALSIDPHSAGAIAALLGALAFGMGTAMSYLAGLFYDGTPRPMMITIALNLIGTAAALRLLALRRNP